MGQFTRPGKAEDEDLGQHWAAISSYGAPETIGFTRPGKLSKILYGKSPYAYAING